MKFNIIFKTLLFVNIFFFAELYAKENTLFISKKVIESPVDSINVKNQKAYSRELVEYYKNKLTSKVERNKPLGFKKYKSFASLEKENTTHFQYSFENLEPEFTQGFIVENFPQSPTIDSIKTKAKTIFEKVKELKKFVNVLTGDHFFDLPVGLSKKDASGNNFELVVSEAKLYPKYAELKLFAKLDIPQRGIQLFFGAEGVKFSHKGAFVEETKLILLGDQPIPFNADNWLITLKGSSNLKTNIFDEKSFVSIDCNGLKEISLEADLRVSRSVLIPLNEQGFYQCGAPLENNSESREKDNEGKEEPEKKLDKKCYVGTSFKVKAKGWNDLLVEIDLPPFEINGFKGWAFEISNTVLDLSDTRNSENVLFPDVYRSFLAEGEQQLWRGVYAKEVNVSLPKAIEKNGQRTSFKATDLLLDSNGVSGKFTAKNILSKEKGAAGKWPFSIDSLGIEIALNKLNGGKLTGDLKVPIADKPFGYNGWISNKNFGFQVELKEKVNIPIFLAEMELAENSSVAIDVIDDKIYPKANLSGSLTIKANIGQQKSSETLGASSENKTSIESTKTQNEEAKKETDLVFAGIKFEELELNSRPGLPIIRAKKFQYQGQNNLFNFPVSIDSLRLLTPSKNLVGLGFNLRINFDNNGSYAKGKLGVLGKIDSKEKFDSWTFEKVDLSGVAIDIERSGTKISGKLEAMKNDPTYGNGLIRF
ncbi:hypothetical protein [Aquimarina agarilytica]|uniref:hypothetical protein n=1 Tax=Aquimarina agarilytica TaxID=1087449 RepID=UPI000288C624|nr:hypothetical protein [Aquimarina agarilytica]